MTIYLLMQVFDTKMAKLILQNMPNQFN